MNYMSTARRAALEQIKEARDNRSDFERFKEAVATHLSNIRLCETLVEERGYLADIRPLAAAEKAFDDSRAELFRQVEDLTCFGDMKSLGMALLGRTVGL